MTNEELASLGPAFASYLRHFAPCFSRTPTFSHLGAYCRGLLSDLPRKSVEPIALSAGIAARTLQGFLANHLWDENLMRSLIQRRIVADHLPPPDQRSPDELGVIGWIDETSVAKKGDKSPGVQRQYCGSSGKVDNCLVTVHLACRYRSFMGILDNDLFLPEKTWDGDRERCEKAHIPQEVIYASKWLLALDQIKYAMANGIRFDWLTFDEWYGGKPGFLAQLSHIFPDSENFRVDFPLLTSPARIRFLASV